MPIFKGEEMPSIKGEIDKLDARDAKIKADAAERQRKEYESSPEAIASRRIELAVKGVHIETFSQEALDKARADLEEAEKGLDDMLDEQEKNGIPQGEYWIAMSNSTFWHTKISVAKEEIRQLEALRDKEAA